MIKRTLILCLLVLNFLSFNIFSQDKIYFDVKTKLAEKSNFVPAKIGVIHFLSNSDKYGVKEFGEDYSLWLKGYKTSQEEYKIKIEFTLEIHTPAMFREGRLLKKDNIFVTYDIRDSLTIKNPGLLKELNKSVNKINDELLLEVYYCGKESIEHIEDMIKAIKD